MVDLGPLHPWDRQPGETSKAYEAFVTYRDMGPGRTTAKVAQALGKSTTVIHKWSSLHHWVSRSAAWDSIPGQAVVEAYQEMAARIAAQHERVATKALARLEANMDALPEGKTPGQTWAIVHGAVRQGHAYATELTKPESGVKKEISDQIAALLAKLSE
jgi:hypothetical protein